MNYRTRKIIYDFILERLSIITIIIIALSSCHTIPLTYNDQISLSAEVLGEDEPTKGSLIDNATKIQGVGFKVSAYNCATDWATNGGTTSPSILINQEVNWVSPNWTYTPLALWPSSGKVSFFACSPKSIGMIIGQGAPTINYITPSVAENQVDLLTSQQMDKTYADGKVKFTFKHSLACIGFQAKRHPNSADTKIVITKLDVKYTNDKVISQNKFTFNTADNSGGTWGTATAKFTGGKISENIQKSPTIELTEALQIINAENKYLMLIPQELAAGDLQVVVTYTVNNSTNISKTVNLPAIYMEMGKRYLFNLLVSGDKIEYGDVSITAWNSTVGVSIQEFVLLYEFNTLSNCYMVPLAANQKTILKFPAVQRVNQFWGTSSQGGRQGDSNGINTINSDGTGGGTKVNGDGRNALDTPTPQPGINNSIGINDKWCAEIIWADFDYTTKVATKQTTSALGVGVNEKLEIIFDKGVYSGNMVVGLKKRTSAEGAPETYSDYLWSWHIWITDYKPNSDYILMDVGTVTVSTAHKVMNRNLGATSGTPINTTQQLETFGLYYQWGRKDPFVGSGSVPTIYTGATVQANNYVIKSVWPSSTLSAANNASEGTLIKCVQNPNIFYQGEQQNNNVTTLSDAIYSGYLSGADGSNRWGGAVSHTDRNIKKNYKTIYDPCPTGWRVPWGGGWIFGNIEKYIGTEPDNFQWSSSYLGRFFSWTTPTAGNNFFPHTFHLTTKAATHPSTAGDNTLVVSGGYNPTWTAARDFTFYWSGSPVLTTLSTPIKVYSLTTYYDTGNNYSLQSANYTDVRLFYGGTVRCVEDK